VLLANYAVQNRNCGAFTGNAFTNPMALFNPTVFNGFYVGDAAVSGETSKSAFNNGYATTADGGTAWHLSPKAGGLACNTLTGTGSLSITSLSLGKALEAALTGSGEISAASLALIVQLAADLTGTGMISAATLQAITNLSAALSGSGSISAAALSLVVALQADLTGSGSLAGNLRGTAGLAADIVVTGTGLTTSNVGAAVWSAIAAANNDAGTMGEKLNDAGSSGNPWATVIESGYTAEEILRLIAAYVAGNATGLDGAAQFTGLDGSTVRIEGTVTGGTRAITALDGS
jgi:hypothetical protein